MSDSLMQLVQTYRLFIKTFFKVFINYYNLSLLLWTLFQQMGSRTSVSCLSISPCTKVVTSGQNDNTISLWDTATQCRKHILFGHTGADRCHMTVNNHVLLYILEGTCCTYGIACRFKAEILKYMAHEPVQSQHLCRLRCSWIRDGFWSLKRETKPCKKESLD